MYLLSGFGCSLCSDQRSGRLASPALALRAESRCSDQVRRFAVRPILLLELIHDGVPWAEKQTTALACSSSGNTRTVEARLPSQIQISLPTPIPDVCLHTSRCQTSPSARLDRVHHIASQGPLYDEDRHRLALLDASTWPSQPSKTAHRSRPAGGPESASSAVRRPVRGPNIPRRPNVSVVSLRSDETSC